MAKRMPNLMAVLGLLAVAGYQHRDKLGELLGRAQEALSGAAGASGTHRPAQGADRELGEAFEGDAGGTVSGGLGELIDRFRQAGEADTAESWVRQGPNQPLRTDSLERALGGSLIDELSAKTGLDRAEILARLSNDLPRAVDDLTPEGHLPTSREASRFW